MLNVGREPILTPSQAATRAGVSRRHIYRLIGSGKIATVYAEGRRWVSARSLDSWMLHQAVTPEERARRQDQARSDAATKANETRRKETANA